MVMVLCQHATRVLTLWQQQEIGAKQALSTRINKLYWRDQADPFDGYSCHVQMYGHKTGKKQARSFGTWQDSTKDSLAL